MAVKVAKFGGSSLADAAQIRKAIEIVQQDAEIRYVVPSAPGKRNASDQKITDLLYLCHASAAQQVPITDTFERIAQRYLQIAEQLGATIDLRPHLDEVRRNIENGASSDYTASRGEYLNGLIIADVLGYDFVDPAEMIEFDARGRFQSEATHARVATTLKAHERAVVPGFYGSDPEGEVKTFSRGGSDITGAIVARGVGASVYENWTDVSGLLMADPRIVPNPRPIDILTYRELRELAYMGASVLHDEAIFPVRMAGIPVNIRNTNRPADPGTMIVKDQPVSTIVHDGDHIHRVDRLRDGDQAVRPAITGIAGRRDFTVIAIEKALMNAQVGFGRRVLGVLENNEVSFEHMPSGIDTLSVVVSDDEVEDKLDELVEQLHAEVKPDSVDVYPDMALLATVGRGMAHTPGMAARLFGALADASINIRMIDQGSSELNIIVGVEVDDFEAAMRAIYKAFVK
jgi:aspartate kinase